MAGFDDQADFGALVSALLILLLNAQDSLFTSLRVITESPSPMEIPIVVEDVSQHVDELNCAAFAALHCFQLCSNLIFNDPDLGFWVKPRSTTWFSRFVMEEYDDERWTSLFRMTKASVLHLSDQLRPHIHRQNTRYRHAIPVIVRVACTLFKLAQGSSMILCSELFAIGTSTVLNVVHNTCRAINIALRHEISWPTSERILQIQNEFKFLCGLPAIVGAIDGTHISISKPRVGPEDYFYFKTHGYTLNCQAVVDSRKIFLDLFLGMPGSTNDARVLKRSSLYQLSMTGALLDASQGREGFPPYLLGDSGYPLLPWLMIPHRGQNPTILEALCNRKLRRGRGVVENAFGILKETWQELLTKTELNVVYLPDVIMACAILHNILRRQGDEDLHATAAFVDNEGLDGDSDGVLEAEVYDACDDSLPHRINRLHGEGLRRSLANYLGSQRGVAS